jgi:hypothetical protein
MWDMHKLLTVDNISSNADLRLLDELLNTGSDHP